MGGKSNVFETALLQHIFQNADIANIGDAAGLQNSATAGNLYVALCTSASVADDTTAGTEAAYTGYARVAVERSSSGWTVSGNQVVNAADVVFGDNASAGVTIRYVEIYTAASGGTRLYWTRLSEDYTVASGVTPMLAAGKIDIRED